MRPPTWPPIETLEMRNEKTTFSTTTPSALPPKTQICWRSSTSPAPRMPNTAPEAPTVKRVGRHEERSGRAGQRRDGVDAERSGRGRAAASSACPNHQSMSMLKTMWIRLACRNAAVTRRHHSPSATAGPKSAPVDDELSRRV